MKYDNEQFRKEMIRYISEHWKEDLSAEQTAETFGYTQRYFNKKFRECFCWPFGQYVTKLKLHRVAKLMIEKGSPSQLGPLAGFSNPQSFSKGFRKEFGLSPKQFLCSLEEIPDMPLFYTIHDMPIQVEYLTTEPVTLHGWLLPLAKPDQIHLTRERGYYFDHYDDRVNLDPNRDRMIGMWWHDAGCELSYFIGKIAENGQEAPKGMMKITLPGEYYAKLSVQPNPKTKSGKKLYSSLIKELAQWSKEEWMILNQKQYVHTGFVFEMYDADQVALYIPVPKRTWGQMDVPEGEGTQAWTRYIDEHIREDITIQDLAEHFHYSERHFRDTFMLYYTISPSQYMKKRRLYMIAKELRSGEQEKDAVIRSYGYTSLSTFRNDFFREFQVEPDEYTLEYSVMDMEQYYSLNRNTLKVSMEELEEICLVGKDVVPPVDKKHEHQNFIKYIANALVWQDKELYRASEGLNEEEKFLIWQTEPETEDIVCLVCARKAGEEILSDSLWEVKLLGGRYAVLEIENPSLDNSLEEEYQRLYRCVCGGWGKENRARIDFSRLAFVRYLKKKLYFYIPVYE